MGKIIGVYKITSPSNKIYIGQSIDIYRRFNKYKKLNCKNQLRLYNSFLKHGCDNHKFEILQTCKEDELNELEIYYIDSYQSYNNKFGMNLREGGGSKGRHSEESKRKMSISRTGKTLSKESRNKISESHKGLIMSDETKKKIGIANKGRILTGESRMKMSVAKKGKRISKETEFRGKPLIQYDKYNLFIAEYSSLIEAEKITNVFRSNISQVCNNKRKTAGGFIWKFKE